MQTDTYSNLLTLVKALSGNTSLTPQEETLIGSFINRRIYNAYRRSSYWPRYMVLGEARAASSNVIPFDQVTLNSIDTFLRVYDQQPYLTNSVDEFEFVVTYDGARVLANTDSLTTFYVDYKKRWEGDYNNTTNPKHSTAGFPTTLPSPNPDGSGPTTPDQWSTGSFASAAGWTRQSPPAG